MPTAIGCTRHKALLAKTENNNDLAISEYKAAIAALPQGTLPEGELYPVQLRLNLADLYRESGDERAAHQTIAEAEEAGQQAACGRPGEGGIPAYSRRAEDHRRRFEGC